MKIFACVVLAIVCLCILALLYYLVVGAILFKMVFARNNISSKILQKDFDERLKRYKIDLSWWQSVKFEKVCIKSEDNLTLVGQFYQANSNKTAIIFHGFGGSYIEMQPYVKLFHDQNFSVLAVDLRAHGQSEGNCVGYGWLDSSDVKSWVDYVCQRLPNDKILLFGLSMGGAAVCMASGKKLQNVQAIISDCAFANADKQICHVMREHKFLLFLFKKHLYSYVKRLYGFDITQANAVPQVRASDIHMLFIHGQADNFVPVENATILFGAAKEGKKEKYIVQDAGHAMCYSVDSKMYEKRIIDFLKKHTNF